jgi:hypothetical protein
LTLTAWTGHEGIPVPHGEILTCTEMADIANGSIGGAEKKKEPGGVSFEAWAKAKLVPALE